MTESIKVTIRPEKSSPLSGIRGDWLVARDDGGEWWAYGKLDAWKGHPSDQSKAEFLFHADEIKSVGHTVEGYTVVWLA